ncbi:DUF3179 domain-containing (seleno)protein [Deferrisoma sp.]|nr:MAG: DUF3179 domain-containing protein [Candidatus Dadabacteria bacterium]
MDLAAVYSRRIDGRTLTLTPSGWTYRWTFVLVDRETGTLWYPERGGLRGIQGPLAGRRLPAFPSADTSWEAWRRREPDSRLLE